MGRQWNTIHLEKEEMMQRGTLISRDGLFGPFTFFLLSCRSVVVRWTQRQRQRPPSRRWSWRSRSRWRDTTSSASEADDEPTMYRSHVPAIRSSCFLVHRGRPCSSLRPSLFSGLWARIRARSGLTGPFDPHANNWIPYVTSAEALPLWDPVRKYEVLRTRVPSVLEENPASIRALRHEEERDEGERERRREVTRSTCTTVLRATSRGLKRAARITGQVSVVDQDPTDAV